MVGKLFKVVISRVARKKLRFIYNYQKKNASPRVAKKIRDGLLDEAENLNLEPESRPLLKSKKQVSPPYRYQRKWSYKIIFQVFKKKKQVRVVEFMHDREDSDKWEDL